MDAGYYVIFLKSGTNLCLGINSSNNGAQVVQYSASSNQATWQVASISGTGDLYLQHQATSLCACFGNGSQIGLASFDPNNKEFVLHLDDVGDGYVAINNHDRSYVMDANGDDPGNGANVSPWGWNGGDNQRWKFTSTAILTGGPS